MRRRNWLKLGFGAAAILAVGGGVVALRTPGLREAHLTPPSRHIVGSIGQAVLDGILPTDPTDHQIAMAGLLTRVDTLVAALPAHAQSELSQLLALLATAPGRLAVAGLETDWPQASIAQVQAALQGMRTSGLALRRQAYLALHEIVDAAYFSDPSSWAVLGYPGPAAI